MSKEGLYIITSRGRRLLRALKQEVSKADADLSSPKSYYQDTVLKTDYGQEYYGEIGGEGPEYIHTMDRGFKEVEEEPRSSIVNTIEVLQELKDEGPYEGYEPGWVADTLDWLVRNKYADFVSSREAL